MPVKGICLKAIILLGIRKGLFLTERTIASKNFKFEKIN